MNMLIALFHRFKWWLALATGLSTISAMAGVTMLTLISDAIDAFGKDDVELEHPFYLFIAVIFSVVSFGIFAQFVMLKLTTTTTFEIKSLLLKRVLATPYKQIEKIGGHRVLATLEGDVGAFSTGLLMLPNLVFNIVTILACMGYMLYSSWQLSILVFVIIGGIYVFWKSILKRALIHQTALREYTDQNFSNLRELVNGGKEINLNTNRIRYFYNVKMIPLFNEIRERTVKSELLFISAESLTNILIYCLIGLIVYGSSTLLPAIDSSIVVAFVLIVLYLVEPLGGLTDALDDVNQVKVSLNKIEKLELVEPEVFKLPERYSARDIGQWKKIEFQDVKFQYDGAFKGIDEEFEEVAHSKEYQFSLKPINLELNAGEITFVTGGNGSGKTTFAKLLIGMYEADAGHIIVDGKTLGDDISIEEYKNSLSVLFADFYIFKELLGQDGELADDDLVMKYIKLLNLKSAVDYKDGVLSKTQLSQGQKKRLTLLQALINDSPIFIFDEVAADQDPEFKQYFYCELLNELKEKGKIIVVISHDSQYFNVADKVISFEDGMICEKGGK